MAEVRTRSREGGQRALDLTNTVDEGMIFVRRAAYGVETEERERIRVPVFRTAPARVRVCGSVTRNLGDFNSARVEVSIEMPCYPEESEVRRVYDWASALLDEMVPAELAKATGEGEAANGQ